MFAKILWSPIIAYLLIQTGTVEGKPQSQQNIIEQIQSTLSAAVPPFNAITQAAQTSGVPDQAQLGLTGGLNNIIGNVLSGGDNAGQLDILSAVENLQGILKNSTGDSECGAILTVIDQTTFATKEMRNAMVALRKVAELWRSININDLGRCLIVPRLFRGLPPEVVPAAPALPAP